MPGAAGAEYILVQTVEQGKPGINGGIYKRMDREDKARNFIGVSSIDSTLRMVTVLGGKVIRPKTQIPGIGWAAFIADPEGNLHGLFQDDPSGR